MEDEVEDIIVTTFKAMGEIIEKDEENSIEILKADDEERIVYGVVVEPMTDVTEYGDAHGDVMTEEEIKKSAHGYMRNARVMKRQHKGKAVRSYPVESYLAPVDFVLGGQKIKKGSWIIGSKIDSDVLWTAIKKGEITGFSPGGFGVKEDYN